MHGRPSFFQPKMSAIPSARSMMSITRCGGHLSQRDKPPYKQLQVIKVEHIPEYGTVRAEELPWL